MATRLLLSDDSITIQKVVELVLAEEGFEIKPTNNGEDAFQSLDSFTPDIVLADIEMPKMNGYQLCEKIKNDPRTANVPVILMAPAFEPIDEELAKKVGAADYIIKPFESQELLNKINGALAAGGVPVKAQKAQEPEQEAVAVAEPAEAVSGEDPWAMDDLGTAQEAQPVQAEADADGAFVIPEEEVPAEAMATEETAPVEAASEEIPAPDDAGSLSEGDIKDSVRVSVSRIVVDSIRKMDMKEVILAALMPEMKSLMEDIIRKSAPKIIEGLVKDVMKEVSAQVRKDIEKIIWETVPDLAESIIKKEIDSIKSEV